MSIQSWIDWWRNYQAEKAKVVSCGVWPFAFPPKFDIFLKCCTNHDREYQESELVFAVGVIQQNEALKQDALELKQFADAQFYACVRARYATSFFLIRPIAKLWGEKYIELVLANGDRTWFGSVGVIIADAVSGEHPVIQKAIRRAILNGSIEEKNVVKKAYTLSRETKTHH